MLAADALVGSGGEIAPLAKEAIEALDAVLPPSWSHGDPIGILGDATSERYTKAIEIVAADQAMLEICRRLGFHRALKPGDPMLESFMDLT